MKPAAFRHPRASPYILRSSFLRILPVRVRGMASTKVFRHPRASPYILRSSFLRILPVRVRGMASTKVIFLGIL